jgi:outer membrane protein OmpA-like peptidoglycan-associated protein
VGGTLLNSATDVETLVRPGHYEVSVTAPDFRKSVLSIDVPEAGAAPRVVLSPSRARWVGGRIALSDELRFEGRAKFTPESEKILDDIAALLKRYPEIRRVRIDSHTGVAGDVWANQAISDARADAVRNALVKRGIAASRLQPLGYGGSRPIAEGTSTAAEARNRRIELWITSAAPRKKK